IEVYGLTEEGNFEEEATRERTGENILHLQQSLQAGSSYRDMKPEEFRRTLEDARRKLFDAREHRVRPGRDDKILTDWNGMMIAALSRASAAFDRPSLLDAAAEAAGFVLRTMRDESGRLLHRYRNGDASISGNLD